MKVCLIDDDVVFCEALKKRLKQLEVDISFFHEFSTDISPKGYDVFVVDINLNGISGVDVVKQLKIEDSNTPILIASGSINTDTRQKLIELGVRDFILKPFTGMQLKEKLQEISSRRIPL